MLSWLSFLCKHAPSGRENQRGWVDDELMIRIDYWRIIESTGTGVQASHETASLRSQSSSDLLISLSGQAMNDCQGQYTLLLRTFLSVAWPPCSNPNTPHTFLLASSEVYPPGASLIS